MYTDVTNETHAIRRKTNSVHASYFILLSQVQDTIFSFLQFQNITVLHLISKIKNGNEMSDVNPGGKTIHYNSYCIQETLNSMCFWSAGREIYKNVGFFSSSSSCFMVQLKITQCKKKNSFPNWHKR